MSRRSIGVMAIAMLLIVGLIAPVSADGHVKSIDLNPSHEGAFAEDFDSGSECLGVSENQDGWHFVHPAGSFETLTVVFSDGTQTLSDATSRHPSTGRDGVNQPHAYFATSVGAQLISASGTGSTDGQDFFNLSHACPGVADDIMQTVVFSKEWIGDTFDDTDLGVTFTVEVDGVPDSYGDGEVIYYEDNYLFISENVSGFPEDVCSWEFDSEVAGSSTTMEGDTAAYFIITNAVTCDDVTPTPDTVTINKVWTGDLGTEPGQTVTFSYDLEDAGGTVTQGSVVAGGTVELLPGGSIITFTGENLEPGLPDECDYTASYRRAGTTGESNDYTNSGTASAQVFNVTNDVTCDDENGDEGITITLAKEWFDVDGSPIPEPEGIGGWSLTLVGFEMDGEDVVDVPLGLSADFEAGQRYGVQESPPDGYAAVPCGGLTTTGAVAYNTSSVSVGLGAPDGTFGATDSGVHLVCNQELPVVGRLADTVTVLKEWTGDFDGEGVVATFSYVLDSPAGSLDFTETGTFTEGDEPIQLELDQSIQFTGETLSAALPEGCTYDETYELVGATGDIREHTDAGGFTAQTFVVTNDVTCIGTEVLPVIIEREPKPAPRVVEREVVEVLGVTATRAVPTGIDTGTGGYLPSSTPPAALLMLLMFGGLVLTGGATASLVRRRG